MQMTVENLKNLIEDDINQALSDLSKHFTVEWGESEIDHDNDELLTLEADLVFNYETPKGEPDIVNRYAFLAGWSESDSHGLVLGEDSDIYTITRPLLFECMFFDKVFENFEGEAFL